MAWFLGIINAFGIMIGFLGEPRVASIVFGISFMALTIRNSKITWKWFGALSDGFNVGATVDHKITSVVITFMVMMAIYLVLAVKKGMVCALLPGAQNIFYWLWEIRRHQRKDKTGLLLLYVLEMIVILALITIKELESWN